MDAPVITIFVRHSADSKYHGDEFTKRCQCKKHLRWTMHAKQYRKKTGPFGVNATAGLMPNATRAARSSNARMPGA